MLQEVSAMLALYPGVSALDHGWREDSGLRRPLIWNSRAFVLLSCIFLFASINVIVRVSWLCSVSDVCPPLQHSKLVSNTSPAPKHHRGSCTRAGWELMHRVDSCWALHHAWGISSCEALTNVNTSVLCLLLEWEQGQGSGPQPGICCQSFMYMLN